MMSIDMRKDARSNCFLAGRRQYVMDEMRESERNKRNSIERKKKNTKNDLSNPVQAFNFDVCALMLNKNTFYTLLIQ